MYKDEQATKFNDKISQVLNAIPKSHTILMGLDINATVSNSTNNDDTDADFTLISPHRNKFRNE